MDFIAVKRALLILVVSVLPPATHLSAGEGSGEVIQWRRLADFPDRRGVAGAFAGITNGALLVGGGANFPLEPLFKDGRYNKNAQKVWWQKVYVLPGPGGQWQEVEPLPKRWAYGASVTTEEGVICIGGSDEKQHYADVFRLVWKNNKLFRTALPSLPSSCAFTGAVLLDSTIYVAGGQESPAARKALRNFWSLDLAQKNRGWRELEAWPGAGRILPVMAAQDGSVFVLSGCELRAEAGGKVSRRYLRDGYRFTPGKGGSGGTWIEIAELPQPVAGAPTPAVAAGESHFLVMGGDHGKYADKTFELKDKHPGFSVDVLAYHTITDTWVKVGTAPAGQVTTAAVVWKDEETNEDLIVIPSGEIRPGVRTPTVWTGRFVEIQTGFGWFDYVTWSIYLGAVLGMGFYFSRREKGTDDFFLGGKRVRWWAAGISIFGTQLSAITFMAIPAKVYATDWVYILAQAAIILVAPLIVFFYLPFYRRLNVTTVYEYLEKRFSVSLRLLGGLIFCCLQLGRMGIVLFLPAIALSTVTELHVYTCILMMGILCTIYTVLGGIEAVIWTDVLQVAVLLGGALLGLAVIVLHVEGGLVGILELGRQAGKFHAFNWSWDYTAAVVWVVLLGNLLGNLVPYSADQTVVQRYLTTSTEKQAAQAVWTNAALTIPAAFIFFFLGTALFCFYKTHPELLNPHVETDAILPWFIARQLPTGAAGLLLAAIFAAAMSSLDSSMNSMATVLVTDFYYRFKPQSSDRWRLRLARILTVALGAFGTGCALLMASLPIKSLWDLFLALIGLLGGGLAGMFALGIFTRRANSIGAFTGVVCSSVVLYYVQRHTDTHFFLYAGVGIGTCVIIGYLVSLMTPAGKKTTEKVTIYSR